MTVTLTDAGTLLVLVAIALVGLGHLPGVFKFTGMFVQTLANGGKAPEKKEKKEE